MPQPPFDVQHAHRWFAVETNNLAWDLIEAEARSAADAERMLHAAHASCHHWLQVGAPLNQLRGECLLATAYAAAGIAEAAARHAQRCLSLLAACGEEPTPFDRATAYGCAARASALLGKRDQALAHYAKATEQVARFEHPEDRALFEKLYPAP